MANRTHITHKKTYPTKMMDIKNLVLVFLTLITTSQSSPIYCSVDYSRLFMLDRLQYVILPRIEELKARTSVHLSEEIINIIDDLKPASQFPELPTKSNCTHCGETTNCYKLDCTDIDSLLSYFNSHVSSQHQELVEDLTDKINSIILNGVMDCGNYNGPIIGPGKDVEVDIQYRAAKDSYKFLTLLQERYS